MINTVTQWVNALPYSDDRAWLGILCTVVVCAVVWASAVTVGRMVDARRASYWSRMARRATRRNARR